MKDVISVDTILAGVFLEGAEVPKTDNPDKDLDVYMERSEYHIPIAQANLHSLLISKLPEKGTLDKPRRPIRYIGVATLSAYDEAFNQAVDDMRKSIAEMFRSGDE